MKNEQAEVTVKVGEKDFSKTYQRTIWEVQDILAALQTEDGAKGVLKNLNYAVDLKNRANVRNEILNEQAGPEKALDKMAKALIAAKAAMGKTVTMEWALAKVKAMQSED